MLTFESGLMLSDALTKVSEQDIQKFREFAEDKIAQGEVQRLTDAGIKQAVENIAYRIFLIAHEGNKDPMLVNLTKEEFFGVKEIEEQISTLDKIYEISCIASLIHPKIFDALVNVRVNEYIEQWLNVLKEME